MHPGSQAAFQAHTCGGQAAWRLARRVPCTCFRASQIPNCPQTLHPELTAPPPQHLVGHGLFLHLKSSPGFLHSLPVEGTAGHRLFWDERVPLMPEQGQPLSQGCHHHTRLSFSSSCNNASQSDWQEGASSRWFSHQWVRDVKLSVYCGLLRALTALTCTGTLQKG